jgi:hypothetical protein
MEDNMWTVPVKPKVKVPGDRNDEIMAITGWIKAYEPGQVLWCFGFLPETPQAEAYGVSVERYVWVLAKEDGTVILQFRTPPLHLLGKEVKDETS